MTPKMVANMSPSKLSNSFTRLMERCFKRLGYSIGSRPHLYLLASALLCSLSLGLTRFEFATEIRDGFTPLDAPSRYEDEVRRQFSTSKGEKLRRLALIVRAKDGGSLLRADYFDAVEQFGRFVGSEFNVTVDSLPVTFNDMCTEYCHANVPLWKFKEAYAWTHELGYPIATIGHMQMNMGIFLYGVQQKGRAVESSTLIMLYYNVNSPNDSMQAAYNDWSLALFDWLYKDFASDHLLADMVGDHVIRAEFARGGLDTAPYFVCGIVIMCAFAALTVVGGALFYGQMRASQLLVAAATVASPLQAVAVTFGLILLLGYKLYPMMLVMPFLILAIGVDDAFLMTHSWNRLTRRNRLSDAPPLSVPERMAFVMQDIGPSILITSLTNCLAFGVGATTTTPIIRLFCLGTSVAMAIDFVLEVVFFGAVLAVAARFESPPAASLAKDGRLRRALGDALSAFLHHYCRFLASAAALVVALVVAAALLSAGLAGVMSMKTRVSTEKLLPPDSPLIRVHELLGTHVWPEYHPFKIFVHRPPNISDPAELGSFMAMVSQFEQGPYALGSNATMLWLREYIDFYDSDDFLSSFFDYFDDESQTLSYDRLAEFLDYPFRLYWKSFIHMSEDERGSATVEAFVWSTAYKDVSTWELKVDLMEQWRAVAAAHATFNVTVWQGDGFFVDAILMLRRVTVQTVLVTLLCMAAVCAFFVPNACGVVAATAAIASISVAVTGFMTWWGLDLDPITMASILMSIGFSVDFTAHVSYHFHKSAVDVTRDAAADGRARAAARLEYTMGAVGWPMVQAALSTVFCVLPLAFNDGYPPKVFVKTIFLVVCWGMLHGLLILPVFISALPDALTGGAPADSPAQLHELEQLHNGHVPSTTSPLSC